MWSWASSPPGAPGIPAARRSALVSRRATPSSARARRGRRSAPQPLLRKRRAQDISARRSSPARSCADTHTLACRSNPSRCACRGPRDVTAAAVSRASPSRRTRAPAREPSATRPWTEAPTISASTGDSSASRSAGPVASSPAPGRGAPAAAAPGGESSPAPPRPRRRSAPAPDETPARLRRFGEDPVQHEGVKMQVRV
jgi:hypothetical protein